MKFEKLDLNLLVALDALLKERNVSTAANRLCLTQPALSSALRRLREFFNDELLLKSGSEMILTPEGRRLAPQVRTALEFIKSQIVQKTSFDPKTSHRRFMLVASDYVIDVFLAEIMVDFSRKYPNLQFEILPITLNARDQLERGDIDLLFALSPSIEHDTVLMSFPRTALFADHYAVIFWRDSAFPDVITKHEFSEASHVAIGAPISTVIERDLAAHRIARRTDLIVSNYLLIPHLIVGTDRMAVMFQRQAQLFEQRLPIRSSALPFSIPGPEALLIRSPRFQDDEGVQWLVDEFIARSKELRRGHAP